MRTIVYTAVGAEQAFKYHVWMNTICFWANGAEKCLSRAFMSVVYSTESSQGRDKKCA